MYLYNFAVIRKESSSIKMGKLDEKSASFEKKNYFFCTLRGALHFIYCYTLNTFCTSIKNDKRCEDVCLNNLVSGGPLVKWS